MNWSKGNPDNLTSADATETEVVRTCVNVEHVDPVTWKHKRSEESRCPSCGR